MSNFDLVRAAAVYGTAQRRYEQPFRPREVFLMTLPQMTLPQISQFNCVIAQSRLTVQYHTCVLIRVLHFRFFVPRSAKFGLIFGTLVQFLIVNLIKRTAISEAI